MSDIDPSQLAGKVYVAAKAAFSALMREHPWETFYVFGLWTDDSLQFLQPMANTEESLTDTVQRYRTEVDPEHGTVSSHDNLRWSYGDWGFIACDEGAHFDDINALLGENFDRLMELDEEDEDEDVVNEELDRLISAMATGLHRLSIDGFFGTGAARDRVTLMIVGDLPQDFIDASVRMMNPPAVYERYMQQKKT